MSEYYQNLQQQLNELLADHQVSSRYHNNEITLDVAADKLLTVATTLRDHEQCKFEQLIDLCGIDYLHYQGGHRHCASRYAVIYHLLSVTLNHRIRLCVAVTDEVMPIVPSVMDIWSSANWYEREAFDLFGILFEGHTDLRRILTDYGFIGHPFRKDFPISGHVEMRYDAEKQRVVYQPVTIEPRDQIPKMVRHDHRYLTPQEQEIVTNG